MRIVIDTNVLVSALQSNQGASFKLVSLLDSGKFEIAISVAVFLEYEEVLMRRNLLSPSDLNTFLLYLYQLAHKQSIFFLYRPNSKDPNDDMLIELAIASQSEYLVTYNLKDLKKLENQGIPVITPKEFLKIIGEIS
jgi:putative PIN family toxin of toxin-antitoxin system